MHGIFLIPTRAIDLGARLMLLILTVSDHNALETHAITQLLLHQLVGAEWNPVDAVVRWQ